uniref:Uncharacterized protein n=1 Tax=Leptobrachium leishanense TaxID=445787 RepID=A0A8C5P6F9_9ANUR
MPSSGKKQTVMLKDVFTYNENSDAVICNVCKKADAPGEFTNGKRWNEWKLDYLKRHLLHKTHLESVAKLVNISKGGILKMFTESASDREQRLEVAQRKISKPEQVKILIDNVILAIKLNASMLSVQEIHAHVAKYVQLPESWRSKNYAFEFVESINMVVKAQILTEINSAPFHTLIADESTDVSITKMLILYLKFRPVGMNIHKTVFAGILKLSACDSTSITMAIKQFYADCKLDLQKMVMFTSDGASVMLGKQNGVAAQLRREVPHVLEQHCVAHREDLGIDDAWKNVSLMKDIETLLRTVYTLFSKSTVKRQELAELAKVTESDVIAFRPLNEVRWLSRYFAVNAIMRNYTVLEEYCGQQVSENNDPINKYCLKRLRNPQYHVALTVLHDVLGQLADLSKVFQRSCLSPVEAHQLVKAKIAKLRSQYLGECVHWSDDAKDLLTKYEEVDTASVIRFIERVCDHLDRRFPDDELLDWKVFELRTLTDVSSYENGQTEIANLAVKYSKLLGKTDSDECKKQTCKQYRDFKFIACEKVKAGMFKNFNDIVSYILTEEEFSELALLVDICASFQASSAECERGFSLMNATKTKMRNRLQVDHLDCLIRIKTYLNSGEHINLDQVYTRWQLTRDRREQI